MIDLDGLTIDLVAVPDARSGHIAEVLRAGEYLAAASPSVVLGAAAVTSTPTAKDAREVLVQQFGFAPARARDAVRVGQRLAVGRSRSVTSAITGRHLGVAAVRRLRAHLPTATAQRGSRAPLVRLGRLSVDPEVGLTRRVAASAASSRDQPTACLAALLLSSQEPAGDLAVVLSAALDATDLTNVHSTHQVAVDGVIAASYIVGAGDPVGMPLATTRWQGATPSWRECAAPWILPFLVDHEDVALGILLDALAARKLSFITRDEAGISDSAGGNSLTHARDTATSVVDHLTKWADRPLWFDGGGVEPQVMLVHGEEVAYAWVGVGGRGMIVGFDLEHFVPYAYNHPSAKLAAALAIGWHVDTSISLRRAPSGAVGVKRTGNSSLVSGYRYVPTTTFKGQRADVASGHSHPPHAHLVAGHLRTLTSGKPSAAARANAPAALQRRMRTDQTFVQPHQRGSGAMPTAVTNRLSKHSLLGDLLGLRDRHV